MMNDYFSQAELSLAAYADLTSGIPNTGFLEKAGFSTAQAAHFAETYTVVDQYSDATGVSATVFADNDGKKYLAVRGAEGLTDYLTDLVDIALLGTNAFQLQYASLKAKVNEWQGSGVLSGFFTVAGHSLGGFLATGIAGDFAANVSHAYLYNAPGVGGVFGVGNALSAIGNAIGLNVPIDTNKFSNLKADVGISPIAGLGQPISSPIPIVIEDQTASDVTGAPAALNHSQQVLTDALAVYNLYDQFAPSLGIEDISKIIKAESNKHSSTLENSLDALRELLTGVVLDANTRTPVANRDAFYISLYALQPQLQAVSGSVSVVTLASVKGEEIAAAAQSGGSAAMAFRYALLKGNAFAVVGNDALYMQHNTNGELNLYDSATHTGEMTSEYLKQRADFMERKLYYNTQNASYNIWSAGSIPANATDPYAGQNIQWEDRSTGDVIQRVGQVTDNTTRVIFGGQGLDVINGANAADALFGMAGDDTLTGGKGNDYLEGGKGNDKYIYATGDGLDTLLDTDGLGSIQSDGTILNGGNQYCDARIHRSADGKHTYTDVGNSNLVIDGNMLVMGWQAGNLGINLGSNALADVIPSTSHDINGDPLIRTEAGLAPGGEAPDWIVTKRYNYVMDGSTVVSYDVDYFKIDSDGNPTEAGGPARDDTLYGTSASDHIKSGAGVDHIYAAQGGNDFIEAGGGDGYGTANAQPGAWFSDYVETGAGDDHIYANGYIDTATAIAQGNIDANQNYLGLAAIGGDGNDVIVGGTGNDTLLGGAGSDLLIGGAGNDVIEGSIDADAPPTWKGIVHDDYNFAIAADYFVTPVVTFEAPLAGDTAGDVIYAGAGSDYVAGSNGNDVIFGEDGNDALVGYGGNDTILGGKDNDIIIGDSPYAGDPAGNDYLDGGEGNDKIWGNGGDDILIGGKNDDTLYGGAGQDTYIYNKGDGIDTIYDTQADKNILRFGAGVDSNNIKLHLGSLMLDLGNGDAIHINNESQANANGFDRNNVFNSSSISEAANDASYAAQFERRVAA